jgi:hypothetical protein
MRGKNFGVAAPGTKQVGTHDKGATQTRLNTYCHSVALQNEGAT